MPLNSIVIKPSGLQQVHTATLIFLHGLGDTGHGWASILQSIVPPYCKLICPHAPTRPLTVFGGERAPAWFDVLTRERDFAEQDAASVASAQADIEQLLAEETSPSAAGPAAGTAAGQLPAASRCLLGGFSMGGALALYTGLTSQRCPQLAGLIGLSCYLPLVSHLAKSPPVQRQQPPVFMAHGDADTVVAPEMGASARLLMQQKLGVTDLRFRSYAGLGHSAGDQELEDLKEFIWAMLPEKF